MGFPLFFDWSLFLFESGTHIYDFWNSRRNNCIDQYFAWMAMQVTPREGHSLLTLLLKYECKMVWLLCCLCCSYSLARHYLAMWSFWRRANYFCSPIYTRRACCKNFTNCDSQLSHKRLRVAWLEFFFDLCYASYKWSLKALILILSSIWAHLYFSNCFLLYCFLHWFCCVTIL